MWNVFSKNEKNPTNRRTCSFVTGTISFIIAEILSGSALLVPEPTNWPQNLISDKASWHLLSFRATPNSLIVSTNVLICSRCLCHTPECTTASSRYASANFLRGWSTYCKFRQKVHPLAFKPKSHTIPLLQFIVKNESSFPTIACRNQGFVITTATIWIISWISTIFQIYSTTTKPRCHGNEIWDKIGYNSACIRDIS